MPGASVRGLDVTIVGVQGAFSADGGRRVDFTVPLHRRWVEDLRRIADDLEAMLDRRGGKQVVTDDGTLRQVVE